MARHFCQATELPLIPIVWPLSGPQGSRARVIRVRVDCSAGTGPG